MDLRIRLYPDEASFDEKRAEAFRQDLERHVGPAQWAGRVVPGAKGAVVADVATIAVSVLSSQAILALIGVFKSYLDRDRSAEIEVQTAGGDTIRVKASDPRLLSSSGLTEFLDRARAAN